MKDKFNQKKDHSHYQNGSKEKEACKIHPEGGCNCAKPATTSPQNWPKKKERS